MIKFVYYGKREKKSDKKASELFHNIIAAFVKGNPKPKKKDAKKSNK
jgi:hypothetical protein